MRFMLMMHAPRGTGEYKVTSWAPGDLEAHIGFMQDLNKDLKASGELVDAQGLAMPGDAKVVRANDKGAPIVSDGPFAESKEFLAGYWIVEVANAGRAYEIAGKISTAPGPGGKPLIIPVEVRQVMQAPTPKR